MTLRSQGKKKKKQKFYLLAVNQAVYFPFSGFLAKPVKISSDQVNKLFAVFVAISAYTIWQTL